MFLKSQVHFISSSPVKPVSQTTETRLDISLDLFAPWLFTFNTSSQLLPVFLGTSNTQLAGDLWLECENRVWAVAQVVEHLPAKHESQSSNPRTIKNFKKI
jgi:hypothetical protein